MISLVEDLNADTERLKTMTPIDHQDWARSLPSICKESSRGMETIITIRKLLHRSNEEVMGERAAAVLYWEQRKEKLDKQWHEIFPSLPWNVQSTLGQEKNILLLKEMMEEAGSPDTDLCAHLMNGFLLYGDIRNSNLLTEDEKPRHQTEEEKLAIMGKITRKDGYRDGDLLGKMRRRSTARKSKLDFPPARHIFGGNIYIL